MIRASKIPGPRARADALVNKNTNIKVWHRGVEKIKSRVMGAMCG
jgi:ribosomal protein L31E